MGEGGRMGEGETIAAAMVEKTMAVLCIFHVKNNDARREDENHR